MAPSAQAAQLSAALVSMAGGYLRNPVRQTDVTCSVCTTPSPGYNLCYPCRQQCSRGLPTADVVAPLTYAVGGRQSGYVMRGYKADKPVDEHRQVVFLLCYLACSTHLACCAALMGAPVTHWAAVPSLRPDAGPGKHPLHRLVAGLVPVPEVALSAASNVSRPRDFERGHFIAATPLTPRSHVLLFDDTWTSGGHAQSAGLALRDVGAVHVSICVVARWINMEFGDNTQFMRELPDYNPAICPWTGSTCP